MELVWLIDRIDALRQEVDAMRPLDGEVEQRIMQKFRLDWNFHSSNIEGNSLTFGETKTFLLHGLTASGKPIRDHLEIQGHNEAILSLEEIVGGDRPLTEYDIRGLHELILGEPYQIPATTPDGQPTQRWIYPGKYKAQSNHVRTVTGETFYFASPEETPAKMQELMAWYQDKIDAGDVHPLVLAGEFHYRFVLVHPFDDGNGRMARLLMNLILMKHGYPPVVIRTEEKDEYFRALQRADGGEREIFIAHVGEELLRSLEIYLKGARGENIEEEQDINKKIDLFKASLEEKKDSDELPPDRYSQEAQDVVEQSVVSLVEKLWKAVEKFDDLFVRRTVQAPGLQEWAEDLQGTLELLNVVLFKPFGQHPLIFRWYSYQRKAISQFDILINLLIGQGQHDYRIGVEGKELIRKPYTERLSPEEEQEIITKFVEQIMEEIRKKSGQSTAH